MDLVDSHKHSAPKTQQVFVQIQNLFDVWMEFAYQTKHNALGQMDVPLIRN